MGQTIVAGLLAGAKVGVARCSAAVRGRLPEIVIDHYNPPVNHRIGSAPCRPTVASKASRPAARAIAPRRPRSVTPIERVPGVAYGVLERLLGYELRRAQVAMFGAFERATRGLKITPPRFSALVLVGENPGLSQSRLGQVLGIARSGAMMLTDWMEERGYAERRAQPGDARSWGLYLTRTGEQFVARMAAKVLAEDLARSSVLTEGERADMLRLLGKLTAGHP